MLLESPIAIGKHGKKKLNDGNQLYVPCDIIMSGGVLVTKKTMGADAVRVVQGVNDVSTNLQETFGEVSRTSRRTFSNASEKIGELFVVTLANN